MKDLMEYIKKYKSLPPCYRGYDCDYSDLDIIERYDSEDVPADLYDFITEKFRDAHYETTLYFVGECPSCHKIHYGYADMSDLEDEGITWEEDNPR